MLNAIFEVVYALIVFLYVDVGLSNILHEVAGVISQFDHNLECLVVLEYTIGEMADEVILAGVAMKLVYDSHLLVDLVDILSSLILRDLDVEIAVEDELAPFIELV